MDYPFWIISFYPVDQVHDVFGLGIKGIWTRSHFMPWTWSKGGDARSGPGMTVSVRVGVNEQMAQVGWFCVAGEGDYRRGSGGFVSQVCVFCLNGDANRPLVHFSVAGRAIFADLRRYFVGPATYFDRHWPWETEIPLRGISSLPRGR